MVSSWFFVVNLPYRVPQGLAINEFRNRIYSDCNVADYTCVHVSLSLSLSWTFWRW